MARARRLIGYGDAVVLLGGDPAGLAALDQALGGALGLLTGGVSDTVLGLAGAQGRLLRIGRDLLGRLRHTLGHDNRATRTQRITAAHAVLAVTAYFEAVQEADVPFDWADVELTRQDQVALATGTGDAAQDAGRDPGRALSADPPPMPSPHLPFEEALDDLQGWYWTLTARLLSFLGGLAVWERLDETQREDVTDAFSERVVAAATERYQESYARLAAEIPEFGFWSGQVEHQATRATVREALSGVETLLAGLSQAPPAVDVAAALETAYRAALGRPILAEGEVPTGVDLPVVADAYLDPRFRIRAVGGADGGGPADEGWWSQADVREDIGEYLAGALTAPMAATAPLVVLGQPGAGKSMLSRVLAARLPATGFLPVRVVLREVRAEAPVQDQIEYAIRAATGERATWPELVRAAPGRVPVVIFDGFDELLQATGVSQSRYLMDIADFQQREADQGRPVVAIVTSRTAVADRARYPEGSVALRLEPFSEPQIATWVTIWNRANERYFATSGRRPLPVAIAASQPDLAGQPLLLLMLALYDATENALQRDTTGALDEADLYEDLLTSFAAREVGKSEPALRPGDLDARVQRELERLSLVAFAMLNRRRQWVTADELDADLTALLGPAPVAESGFRTPLGQADIALGRFFFVQRAQALRDERRLATYEFLHATFGEYLAVRLAVHVLHRLLDQRSALFSGPARTDDDLLYALLSYVPLSSRQMFRFVRARIGRIPPEDRSRLADLVVQVRAAASERTQHAHADYRPSLRATAARHGVYEANLVLLLLALTGGFTAGELFPASADAAEDWHRHVLLWRSSFDETEWTAFALTLRLRRTRTGDGRELRIEREADQGGLPEPVDLYWVTGNRPEPGTAVGWSRPFAADVRRKMDVSGGTNDSVMLHALEPLFEFLGEELMAFTGYLDEPATSVAHDLLRVWLQRSATPSHLALQLQYERLFMRIHRNFAPLLLSLLERDMRFLPPDVVASVLLGLEPSFEFDASVAERMLSVALAAYLRRPSDDDMHAALVALVGRTARSYAPSPDQTWRQADHHAWKAWVMVHDFGMAYHVYGEDPSRVLLDCDLDVLPPDLRYHIHRVVALHYPHISLYNQEHTPTP